MDIEQARDIPISVILNKLGFDVQRTKGYRDLYYSLIDNKKYLSLRVNRMTNDWHDDENTWWLNGDAVELVQSYLFNLRLNYKESDALNWLKELNYIGPIKPVNEERKLHPEDDYLIFQHARNIKHDCLIEYGESLGIQPKVLFKYFKEVRILNSKTLEDDYALAMRNQAKGYELRNADFEGYIIHNHITFIRGSKPNTDYINIFESAYDYASIITQQHGEPLINDAIILHTLNNLTKAANIIKDIGYHNCFTWMDNDCPGQEATKSWEDFCQNQGSLLHLPMNHLYETYTNVNEAHVVRLRH